MKKYTNDSGFTIIELLVVISKITILIPEGYWLWMERNWRSLVSPFIGNNLNEKKH